MDDSTSSHDDLPTESWNVAKVKDFLNSKKERFYLSDTEISLFENNAIGGEAFLQYTEEMLLRIGLREGPAVIISRFIARLNKQRKFYHKIVCHLYVSCVIQQASF